MSFILRFLLNRKSIGYLTLHETEKAGFLGSFLITDFKGIPIEFRCTHPIKPDGVQKALHGEALIPHIGVELCGKPLLRSAKNRPKIILVDKPFLLDLDSHSPCPMLLVRDAEEWVEGKGPETSKNFDLEYQIEVIDLSSNELKPLEIVRKGEIESKTRELVESLYSTFNIVEPFERMGRAVESLIQKTSRYRQQA